MNYSVQKNSLWMPARVFLLIIHRAANSGSQSVQQMLLTQGQARVSARVGDKSCADALLAAERQAREGRRGLWADPNFAPLPAESSARLRNERGRFALVEGKVLSVHESGGTIYI
jgi:endonuclease YncB( thermonuclease family)